MSAEKRIVWYSVRARFDDPARRDPYVRWLETEHMPDVLRTGHADHAEIHVHEPTEGRHVVEGRYAFRSRGDLERYVADHAPALRAEGVKRFPEFTYERAISTVAAGVSLHEGDKKQAYGLLERQLEGVLTAELPWESRLVSLIALLKASLPQVSWVGFYAAQAETLWVGPYQGPLACTRIGFDQGVCGLAARTRETVIVPDVLEFPGHIACDSLSRSEIVLPVVVDGVLRGVLDLDSHRVAAFDLTDAGHLERLLQRLSRPI